MGARLYRHLEQVIFGPRTGEHCHCAAGGLVGWARATSWGDPYHNSGGEAITIISDQALWDSFTNISIYIYISIHKQGQLYQQTAVHDPKLQATTQKAVPAMAAHGFPAEAGLVIAISFSARAARKWMHRKSQKCCQWKTSKSLI